MTDSENCAYRSLFITDLDGTLFNDNRSICTEDLAALAHARKKNVVTAIATGRSLYSFRKAMAGLGFWRNPALPVDYVLFSTGAGIMTLPGGDILKESRLENRDVVEISQVFDRFGLDYMIHCPIPDTNVFAFTSRGGANPDFESRINLYRAYARCLNSDVSAFGPATQLLAIVPPGRDFSFFPALEICLAAFSVIRTTSPLDRRSIWIEVFPKTVSKSQAASWLADRLNICTSRTGSVGNDYNDRDLLNWTGRGYVVSNAPCDLKPGFRVMPSNNAGGVSAAIASFLEELPVPGACE